MCSKPETLSEFEFGAISYVLGGNQANAVTVTRIAKKRLRGATCHRIADPEITIPTNPLGARNWLKFGYECEPVFSDRIVLLRR